MNECINLIDLTNLIRSQIVGEKINHLGKPTTNDKEKNYL